MSGANPRARKRVPSAFGYHLNSKKRKPAAPGQAGFKNSGRKPATIESFGQTDRSYCRRTTRTRMQFDWRAITGPALTTATALIAFIVDLHLVAVPNPAPLFV